MTPIREAFSWPRLSTPKGVEDCHIYIYRGISRLWTFVVLSLTFMKGLLSGHEEVYHYELPRTQMVMWWRVRTCGASANSPVPLAPWWPRMSRVLVYDLPLQPLDSIGLLNFLLGRFELSGYSNMCCNYFKRIYLLRPSCTHYLVDADDDALEANKSLLLL